VNQLVTFLDDAVSFIASRDFVVNFVANLAGALFGVLLAFWIERKRARSAATDLYGHMLLSSRSELAYLNPMCETFTKALRTGQTRTAFGHSLNLPATRAVLGSPTVHERAPYSLIMALTTLTSVAHVTENALRAFEEIPGANADQFRRFESPMDKLHQMMTLALERIGVELNILGLEVVQDAETQNVSRRLHEILRNSPQ